MATTSDVPEYLRNQIMIPMLQEPSHFFLGLMGNINPTHCINTETNRIPFRQTKPNLAKWSTTFRA
uniref:Uncharacterized protein n=3 Tax=Oryza TaxID=4527 RepID=Q2R6A4_ORYSJ|nr:hypothetical protein LOC_Os11g20740 [Oryza sativa Japonica Group]ABA92918.1 hypothetical protein LOC_Os11g20740 [Oryza sativa Japonica Group]